MEKDLNLNGNATFYFKNEIPYATVPKEYLLEKNLSLKAKGLLTIIYTLPEKWQYNMKGLEKITGKSQKVLRNILKELEKIGYIIRNRRQDEKGRFYYEYFIEIEKENFHFNLKNGNFTV